MTIAALESLSFGLGRTARAATAAGHRLCLLTGDRSVYLHELAALPADALTVVDVDTFDTEAVRRELARLPDLAGLINTTDTWSVPGADLAAEFGLPGPDPGAVRVLRDKAAVRAALHREGLGSNAFVRVEPHPESVAEVHRTVGLPAVLKHVSGTSSRDVWIVHDKEALHAALTEAGLRGGLDGRLFAEPFLAGPLYSAETLTWQGETRLLGVFGRQTSRAPAVREEAAAFPVALPPGESAAVARWVGRVLSAAGHDGGFAHVEFILTAQGPQLVEINRRIGGALVGEALCHVLRTDVYGALIDVTLGRRPALLDAALPAGGRAVGLVLVYADRPGVLAGWHGLDGLDSFPGNVRWYPTREPGSEVAHVGDQRGCTGMVWAEAATAELAQHRAWSAATTVRPVMRDAS
ncbi:ATP-grasp domain-containing protein [Streptomyces sp. NPDC006283]|uniref:ATP-grasp domain-containing protein n=1 Tax=Streptomyces sp. NPDC006283 TaxID=3156741 RepID=UPI0033A7410B